MKLSLVDSHDCPPSLLSTTEIRASERRWDGVPGSFGVDTTLFGIVSWIVNTK